MKAALLISGYLRTFRENIPNLKEKILNRFENIDVYIHITKNSEKEDKYLNIDGENIDFISETISPKCLLYEENSNLSDDPSINNTLNLWFKYHKLNELKIENEKNFGRYDIVIKYRPDLNIFSEIDFDINGDSIYIPKDSKIDRNKLVNLDDRYLCDIFAYGSSTAMDRYFNIYDNLQDLIKVKKTGISETLLYNYLNEYGIEYETIDISYDVLLSMCNVFAIAGDSGSGKTTLGNLLKKRFSSSFLLECDRYHKWERGDENWKSFTHLNTESNYIAKMNEDIFDLKIGKTIYQVDYDHKNGKFTEPEKIDSTDNIVMCGLHSLYSSDSSVYNLKIFVDTDDVLKYTWKIKRDMSKRGYSKDEVMRQIEVRKKDYYDFVYPQREISDIVIRFFTDSDEIEIEKEYDIFLKISVSDRYRIDGIVSRLRSEGITFSIEKEEKFNQFKFFKYENRNIITDPTNSYYDYILFFILSLQQ